MPSFSFCYLDAEASEVPEQGFSNCYAYELPTPGDLKMQGWCSRYRVGPETMHVSQAPSGHQCCKAPGDGGAIE